MRTRRERRQLQMFAEWKYLTLALIPPLLKRRAKIDFWLLPINHRLREEIGSHHVGNLLSMYAQPLIKRFQMLQRGKSHLEQSTMAPTEFMDLQYLWKLLGATGLEQTPLRQAVTLYKDQLRQTKLCDIHLRTITRNDARVLQLANSLCGSWRR